MRGGAVAARRAHNPKVAGSNPAPATKNRHYQVSVFFLLIPCNYRAISGGVFRTLLELVGYSY